MSLTHTPGPWKVSGLDPNVIGPVRILVMDGADVPQQQAVARITDRTGESAANAYLIAAAPEMYKALKNVLSECYDDGHSTTGGLTDACQRRGQVIRCGICEVLIDVRAVVAKAEGL